MLVKEEMSRVLRDFCAINESIIIYPGEVIRTINNDRDTMAEYRPGEVFTDTICIYDLSRFLNSMKILGEEPTLLVDGSMIHLNAAGQSIEYAMSPENTIIAMDREMQDFTPVVEFEISHDDLRKIRQAASALGVQHLTIMDSNGSVGIKVHQLNTSTSNPTDDCFDFVVDSVVSGAIGSSKFVFDIQSLPTYEGDYHVKISSSIVSSFQNKNIDLKYWLAMRDESEVE